MRQGIGAASQESIKSQPWVERGATERLVLGGGWGCGDALVQPLRRAIADFPRRLGLVGFGFGADVAQHRRTHADFDAADQWLLCFPASEQALRIMGCYPALEE